MESALVCIDVTKRFRRVVALNQVSTEFGPGITALLGANGAGKTTLLSILATLIKPSSGVIRVAQNDLKSPSGIIEARRHLGYLSQSFSVLPHGTVEQNVRYSAWVHGVPTNQVSDYALQAISDVDLVAEIQRPARVLSGGQRQRLGIACAIAHRPSVLLLDEPTVGLDPLQRIALRELIRVLGTRSTIILSTHLIEDVAELADHTIVLRSGNVVFDGSTEELSRQYSVDDRAGTTTEFLERAMIGLMQ